MELEPGLNFTAALDRTGLLAATAPARVPGAGRGGGPKKKGGKKREFPTKMIQQKSTVLHNPIFFYKLNVLDFL